MTTHETLKSLRARLERVQNETPIQPEQTGFPFAEKRETAEEIEAKIVEREAFLEEQRALVFLDIHGSTCSTDGEWTFRTAAEDGGEEHTYRYTSHGAPEWFDSSDLDGGVEPDDCICVLASGYGPAAIPEGYRIVFRGSDNEHECPECGPGCGGPHDRKPGTLPNEEWVPEELWGAECELCEGTGYLYDPDRTLVMFAPRYSYGSGMRGCLYDGGPYCATSVEDAIDALVESFSGYFEALGDPENHEDLSAQLEERAAQEEALEELAAQEEALLRATLEQPGVFRFARPDLAGADYCEITDMRPSAK